MAADTQDSVVLITNKGKADVVLIGRGGGHTIMRFTVKPGVNRISDTSGALAEALAGDFVKRRVNDGTLVVGELPTSQTQRLMMENATLRQQVAEVEAKTGAVDALQTENDALKAKVAELEAKKK